MLTPNEEISMYLKTGKSKNVHNLVEFLSESISNFTQQTNSLSGEYPEIKAELNQEINRFKSKIIIFNYMKFLTHQASPNITQKISVIDFKFE